MSEPYLFDILELDDSPVALAELESPPPLRQVADDALDALLPPPRGDPFEWVPANVRFPAQSSATAGYYDFDAYPWHRGVWSALIDPAVREVTLRFPAQHGGKTALIAAYVSYLADQDPCPIVWGTADQAILRRQFSQKLYPILSATPATGRLLPPEHRRHSERIDLRHCVVHGVWGGSPAQLGDLSAQVVIMNELDKWTRAASTEGDPEALLEERKKAFPHRWKIIRECTPSEEGLSRIDAAIARSDDRSYWIPCPVCGGYQTLEWERLVLPHDAAGRLASPRACEEDAYYPCAKCGRPIENHRRLPSLRAGIWCRAGEEADDEGRPRIIEPSRLGPLSHQGFSIWSGYSPQTTWGEIARLWAEAQHDVGKIRSYLNGWLARSYRPAGRFNTLEAVLRHRGLEIGKGYPPDTCPAIGGQIPLCCFLVVDVQADALYYAAWAWTLGKRSYLLRYGMLPGNLDAVLPVANTLYTTANDEQFQHSNVFMDSGDRTKEVYAFCLKHSVTPIKGFSSTQRTQPITWSAPVKELPGLKLMGVNADMFKDELADKIGGPCNDDPGCWRLHAETGKDFAEHLTAERRVVERNKWGERTVRWANKHARPNHWWDCSVYNQAAATAAEWGGVRFFPG